MKSSRGIVEDDDLDGFWKVQLEGTRDDDVGGSGAAARPFDYCDASLPYKDNALPAGTELTREALANVVGNVRDVSIPFLLLDHDHDDRNNDASCTNEEDIAEEDEVADDDKEKQGLGRFGELVLRLREVNEDGVMSAVGGDVWCAAVLLSAWLLVNPETVRGLSVLELGSGLGLCGIAAGYLARTVTLTDYIDELLENLRFNVKLNLDPALTLVENRRGITPSGLPLPRASRRGKTAHDYRGRDPVAGGDVDCAASKIGHSHGILDAFDTCTPVFTATSGRERWSTERSSLSLSPLCQVDVCKLDWTTFARRERVKDASRHGHVGDGRGDDDGDWWEDEGYGSAPEDAAPAPRVGMAEGQEEGTNGGGKMWESAIPRCDVILGSALIYSPHHACVANVLLKAFSEGGCGAAYIVQLSTRPGFDEFLLRLRACGLRYRLQRISAVLPAPLLDELRRRTSATRVVGGPVSGGTASNITAMAPADAGGSEVAAIGGGGDAGGFQEFVLCSIHR